MPMISVLFIGIAIMFLFLALASRIMESSLKKPHDEILKIIEREIARSKKQGVKGYAPASSYFYRTIRAHMWFEIAGFLVACVAAILEYLLVTGH